MEDSDPTPAVPVSVPSSNPKPPANATPRAGSSQRPGGKLGRRLLAWFLLLSLSPLLLSNGLGYLRSEGIIEGLVDRYLKGIADLQALHVSDQLERYTLVLSEMAKDDALLQSLRLEGDGPSRDTVNPFLSSKVTAHPTFEGLHLLAPGGRVLAAAPLSPADLAMFLEPPLTYPSQQVEVVRTERLPRAPQLRISVPVSLPGWEGPLALGGIIEAIGSPGLLQLPEHTAESVETFVVDSNGVLLFVSHPHGHLDYRARFETPLLSADPGASLTYLDRQGVEVVGTTVPIPQRPWRLITEVPVADVLLELRQLRSVSLWLSTLLTLLVIGLALYVSGRIVAPVRRLVSATRALGTGELDTRVDVITTDEIGELGAAFNDMATRLSQSAERLRELHDREMERAGQLATVGELASGVAHEIKNPVAGLSGGLDLVLKRLEPDPDIDRIVDEMRRQISRIEDAVRDLLAFARPAPPRFEAVDLNHVIERATTLVRPVADKAAVTIDLHLDPNLTKVLADPEMIYGSLVNLVVNGVQATEPGGQVAVETEALEDGVRIRIRDTGRGIEPDKLDQIFKPFYTTRHQGTGLGLSICRSVIERHMGSITVESQPGAGSLFTVVLPRRPEPDARHTPVGARPSS
ncbi:MAG: HAMP domain-containing protein [Gemmatimonadetes bacterium]|nr:HAMP domain-containing protein [Gemmatimonadota bacterium]